MSKQTELAQLGDAVTVDSSGNVGINRTSPNGLFHMQSPSGTDSALYIQTSAATDDSVIHFGDDSASSVGSLLYDHSTNSMQFETSASERMRIDSSGNLMVSKTSVGAATAGFETRSSGYTAITRDGGQPLEVRRLTSDGVLIDLRKDSSSVGQIGVASFSGVSAGRPYFTNHSSDGLGIHYISSTNAAIVPIRGNAEVDDAGYLGHTNHRWKDLYLSGGVFLGGTGSANKLDDYEEGTWTPTAGGTATISSSVGRYTKIGRLVTIEFEATYNSSGTAHLGGLPFAAASDCRDIGVAREDNSTGYIWQIVASPSGTNIDLYNYTNSSNVVSGHGVRGTLAYYTS